MAAKKAKSKQRAKKAAPKAKAKSKPAATREFKSLSDVRTAIDKIDAQIVPLLCRRLHFVTQAAHFKPSVKGVVVQSRVEEVIENARRIAKAAGSHPDTIEVVYRALIDAFTADEQRRWREINSRP